MVLWSVKIYILITCAWKVPRAMRAVFAAEVGGYEYLLVLVDDISGFVWLEPAQLCSGVGTARMIFRRGDLYGSPKLGMG